MKATITNISRLPRQHWGVVTFPSPLVAGFGREATFITSDGRRWRAVKGKTVGIKTTYRVRATMGGYEDVEGQLINEAHADAFPLIRPHAWVDDSLKALIPTFGARSRDPAAGATRDEWSKGLHSMSVIDSSPAHQRWHLVRRIPEFGLYLEWWADVLHDDPVIPIKGKIVWSHRGDKNHNREFEALVLKSGEYVALDFATRHGIGAAVRGEEGWARALNSSPVVLNDGAGLPLSGAMLSFINPTKVVTDPEDVSNPDVAGVRDVQAGFYGPIVGVSHDWEGLVMSNHYRPRFALGSKQSVDEQRDRDWKNFTESLDTPAGWFCNRPLGIGKTPGQTGDQDFGAVKGTDVITCLDPKHLRRMQYSVQATLFRGYNHYEDSTGAPIKLEDHPDLVTWSGAVHWHTGVSRDRLGKATGTVPSPGTGWRNYDDQHDARQTEAAYEMLTDDPFSSDQIAHFATTDLAAYRVRYPNFGTGATRAQGRVAGSLAQLLTVSEGEAAEKIAKCLKVRLEAVTKNQSLSVSGPMKVLHFGSPDGRKPIYDEAGNLARWTSMWEHGLAMVGLYNLVKDGHEGAEKVVVTVARMMAEFACFNEGGLWHTVDDILWSDGEPPPGGLSSTSKHMTSNQGTRGVATWTFAGLLVAREVLGPHPKLDAYIKSITGGNAEASDRRQAEWWAAIRDIKFGQS